MFHRSGNGEMIGSQGWASLSKVSPVLQPTRFLLCALASVVFIVLSIRTVGTYKPLLHTSTIMFTETNVATLYKEGLQHFRSYREGEDEHAQHPTDKLRERTLPPSCCDPAKFALLAHVYVLLSKIIDDMRLLDEAVVLMNDAPISNEITHECRMQVIAVHAEALHERFEQRQEHVEDLDKAIKLYKELDILSQDVRQRAWCEMKLAFAMRLKFYHDKVPDSLNASIQYSREALALFQEGDPDYSSVLESLGNTLGERWELLGRTGPDNNEAIECFNRFLRLVPPDNKIGLAIVKMKLANRITGNHDILRNTTDLSEAIKLYHECIEIFPCENHYLPMIRRSLAVLISQRWYENEASSDLDEAIRLWKSWGQSDANNWLTHLLSYRYSHNSDVIDLKEAEIYARKELDEQDDSENHARHDHLATILGNLSHVEHENSEARTLEAIQHARSAFVELDSHKGTFVGLEHHESKKLLKARYLDKLTTLLERLEDISGASMTPELVHVIDDTIEASKATLSCTLEHPFPRGALFHQLGTLYLKRRRGPQGTIHDELEAVENLNAALDFDGYGLIQRVEAGYQLLEYHHRKEQWFEAYSAVVRAVKLIPLLAPYSNDQADKQRVLRRVVGLASQAAAVALEAKQSPREAIELLETGRCVLSASTSKLREDITMLREKHPQLADEYHNIRAKLDPPLHARFSHLLGPEESNYDYSGPSLRFEAEKSFNSVLRDIRSLDGFEKFLVPSTGDDFTRAAEHGPIVIVNISVIRCDAFIVLSNDIRSIRLESRIWSDVADYAWDHVIDTESTQEWMWTAIAKPILDNLGYIGGASGSTWPRVRWILTGPLSKFPIHAAGYHKKRRANVSVIDRVVSSYSISIEAILATRRRAALVTRNAPQAVLISMEKTPDQDDLPNTSKEINYAEEWCKSVKMEVVRTCLDRKAVLQCLGSCTLFHFAGHGKIDAEDPLQSRILLEDWQSNALTVADVLAINVREGAAFMAYLSACRTGQIRHNQYLDESVHMISAFQLAGFRNVVGSLWEVEDEYSMCAAETIYTTLKDKGMSSDSVCIGVHRATRLLREKWYSSKQLGNPNNYREDEPMSPRSERDSRGSRTSCPGIENRGAYWTPFVYYGD